MRKNFQRIYSNIAALQSRRKLLIPRVAFSIICLSSSPATFRSTRTLRRRGLTCMLISAGKQSSLHRAPVFILYSVKESGDVQKRPAFHKNDKLPSLNKHNPFGMINNCARCLCLNKKSSHTTVREGRIFPGFRHDRWDTIWKVAYNLWRGTVVGCVCYKSFMIF